MTVIVTDQAPAPVGPYSQAIVANGMVYVSGVIALLPGQDTMVQSSIEAEVTRIMTSMSAILEAAGSSLQNIVKITAYLTDMADFPEFNRVYASFMSAPFPARATVQVAALPKGARVEIDAIAIA
ncbi:hypothetical protein EB093_04800 [bacterium]|nr:hypothetical protein [bacterium]